MKLPATYAANSARPYPSCAAVGLLRALWVADTAVPLAWRDALDSPVQSQ